eukprot:jgi/Galph1/4356/GphlegSOOS_G2949.1
MFWMLRTSASRWLWDLSRLKQKSLHSSVFVRVVAEEEEKGHRHGNTKTLHRPLGVVPEGTDLEQVREKWQSDAMELISKVPPTVVDGVVAACNGGGGPLGHPIEYIRLEAPYPATCKYCGLRYVSRHTYEQLKAKGEI